MQRSFHSSSIFVLTVACFLLSSASTDFSETCPQPPQEAAPVAELALLQRRFAKTEELSSDTQLNILSTNGTRVSDTLTFAQTIKSFSLLDFLGLQPPRREQFHFDGVSVTLRCVMWLSVMFLGAYTVLACLRNSTELTEASRPPLAVDILEIVVRSAPISAALCALFVACRMYILANTSGSGSPPYWVRSCMVLATLGLSVQVFIASMLPLLLLEREGSSIADLLQESASAHPRVKREEFKAQPQWYLFCASQLFAEVGIYGGAAGVIAGIFTFGNPLEVSPAIVSVVLLVSVFLLGQACISIAAAFSESGRAPAGIRAAAGRAKIAPMIAVFFLAVRMRNLQIDPPKGIPPQWVWMSIYVVVFGVLLDMVASLCCVGSSQPEQDSAGTAEQDTPAADNQSYSPSAGVRRVQQLGASITFGGLGAVAWSVLASTDKEELSTMMKCVLSLCALHFGVHILQWVASFTGKLEQKEDLESTALSAGVCVNLAPLLSILFVACRMRALQLTHQEGDPHWWAQDAMKLGVMAIFLQVCCCILLPIFTGAATKVDSDGNAEYDLRPLFGAYVVQVVKYVALLCLYGAVVAVCASICMMYEGMKGVEHVDQGVKILTQLLWFLSVVALAGMLSSAKVVGFIVKWTIEGCDERLIGVNVWIGKAALSLCRGYVFISNVVVDNPADKGFASPCLLKIGKIVLKIDIMKIIRSRASEIEITALILNDVEVNYEKELFHTSNVGIIVDFLQGKAEDDAATAAAAKEAKTKEKTDAKTSATAAAAAAATAAAASTSEKGAKAESQPAEDDESQVELYTLQVKAIAANVWVAHHQLVSVNLGDIEENFGGKSVPPAFIIQEVLKSILTTVKSNSHRLGSNVVHIAEETAQGSLKKLAGCLPCGEIKASIQKSLTPRGNSAAAASSPSS